MPDVECADCKREGVTTRRPVQRPGPRCATHARAARVAGRDAAHAAYLERTYNITAQRYWQLYEEQGGHCGFCPSNGRTVRLSVDHDHRCCPGGSSCGRCVRGLLCRPCNTMLGRMRDATGAFERAIAYLAAYERRRAEDHAPGVTTLRRGDSPRTGQLEASNGQD